MLKRATIAVAVAGVAAGMTAGSASAWWSHGMSPIKQTGTLSLKLDGGSPISCTYDAAGGLLIDNVYDPCVGGGQFRIIVQELPVWNSGSPYVLWNVGSQLSNMSPWGAFYMDARQVPVVNGNASTPTRLVFNNTQIGRLSSNLKPITATGNLNVTTLTGGLVTIVP